MDDEAETYKLWRIRKTVMQVIIIITYKIIFTDLKFKNIYFVVKPRSRLFSYTG